MDSTTIIIIAVVALVALFLYNRSRSAPRGTYDDKSTRSSGSIGGGTRAYDDKSTRSSGSIGGGTRSNDSPVHKSSGSIGGAVSNRSEHERGIDRNTTLDRLDEDREQSATDTGRDHTDNERRHNDERFKSKGSIGG